MPLFSIIIPLYNKQKDIAATLESVFAQTFQDYELIVINDGSTDGSEAEVLRFDDERLVYHKTENQGVSMARNTGIGLAKGDYIAFLDADDIWIPGHLETIKELFEKFPKAALHATNYRFILPDGALQNTNFETLGENFIGIVDNVFKHSMKNRLMWTSCVAVKKDVFEKVGLFDPAIKKGPGEDTEMWIRIALKYTVAFNTKVTAYYNLKGSNRISHTATLKRTFPRLDAFAKEEAGNPHLKKYLDLYRADYALKHKMSGDNATAAFYQKNLDPGNISRKARILLMLPAPLLRMLLTIKHWLRDKGVFIDTYN